MEVGAEPALGTAAATGAGSVAAAAAVKAAAEMFRPPAGGVVIFVAADPTLLLATADALGGAQLFVSWRFLLQVYRVVQTGACGNACLVHLPSRIYDYTAEKPRTAISQQNSWSSTLCKEPLTRFATYRPS